MDEDDYGDIADEDLIDVLTQNSQALPSLRSTAHSSWNKRRRSSYGSDEEANSRGYGSGGEEDEENAPKKTKYRIHIGVDEVPAAKILGATQAEGHPDSSPYRIRGPIYMKPRPKPLSPPKVLAVVQKTARQSTIFDAFQMRPKTPPRQNPYSRELEDFPSEAFSSPENHQNLINIGSSPPGPTQAFQAPSQRSLAPVNRLTQTTLFGGRAVPEEVSASQARKVQNFIVDLPPEAPTHHKLDLEAIKTWQYPTNLGSVRDYQFSIVKNGLFNNLLVALPTGLGKTFIAATIMLNYFRWTKDAQIVFVAPTKPLVAQQAEACFGIVGIPKSQTTMLTGEQAPILRAEQWAEKRVFFMTPQTFENDLSSGIADPKKIVLLVVDEAHRATGNYSYVKVVTFLRRFNKSFRILALTATPGSTVEAVQQVIDGLEISKVEIRTEDSFDISQYVHRRDIDQIILDPSDEMVKIKELLSKALQPLVNLICGQNAYYNKDPMSLTTFGMLQARKQWFASGAGRAAPQNVKGMMHSLFSNLASVAHSIKLLDFHGIGPFYSAIKDFQIGKEEGGNGGGGKYRKQVLEHPNFKEMMRLLPIWMRLDGFVGHPKLTSLCETILNHFMDAGQGRMGEDMPPSATRVIVFAEWRDSAEEICKVLNKHGPMIRASVFVGQADSKRSEGMNQSKQLETIQNFKAGKINVIVATSIGEEGLDIGQVDLIVCYDASGSPIRMLQRMGRTGRKRAGRIVLLLMRGKEENNFARATDNYEQMQKMISSGQRFNFRHDLSVRIIPKDVKPVVDRRMIEIPIENTQDTEMPIPKRGAKRGKKMPPKKFHMPDGVVTGFQHASRLGEGTSLASFGVATVQKAKKKGKEAPESQLTPIISVESVLLDQEDTEELERRYQNIAGDDFEEVGMPDMTVQPLAQRSLGPSVKVSHGQYTERCVSLFQTLARSQDPEDRFSKPYGNKLPSRGSWYVSDMPEDDMTTPKQAPRSKKSAAPRPQKRPKPKALRTPRSEPAAKLRKPGQHLMVLLDPGSDMEASPGATNQQDISGDDTEGEGDDLARSEELSEDDSQIPSSMLDFVVDDGLRSSIGMKTSSVTRSSSLPARRLKEKEDSPSLFCTQNFDDDLAGFSAPAERTQKRTPGEEIQVPSSDTEVRQIRSKRQRAPIFEDDSDE